MEIFGTLVFVVTNFVIIIFGVRLIFKTMVRNWNVPDYFWEQDEEYEFTDQEVTYLNNEADWYKVFGGLR